MRSRWKPLGVLEGIGPAASGGFHRTFGRSGRSAGRPVLAKCGLNAHVGQHGAVISRSETPPRAQPAPKPFTTRTELSNAPSLAFIG